MATKVTIFFEKKKYICMFFYQKIKSQRRLKKIADFIKKSAKIRTQIKIRCYICRRKNDRTVLRLENSTLKN